uniref:L-fucose mutarotase n=1 Tax=Equus asinus TaxID=9793 RepID=A0A9L0J3X5_EQUAS|nr:fucose mutarotase isoform X1 [Equus asinus]XP_044604197.1 fucose mutarotase isoform X1 [Equus asinus]
MVVLKGVPALLSPELLFALARMGHGDEIVLADVNFPTSSICRCGPEEIRADGLGIPQLLEAVLKLLPLDTYVESPAAVMELEPSDWERGLQTPVWRSYESILFMAGCTGPASAFGLEEDLESEVTDQDTQPQRGGTATGPHLLPGPQTRGCSPPSAAAPHVLVRSHAAGTSRPRGSSSFWRLSWLLHRDTHAPLRGAEQLCTWLPQGQAARLSVPELWWMVVPSPGLEAQEEAGRMVPAHSQPDLWGGRGPQGEEVQDQAPTGGLRSHGPRQETQRDTQDGR